MLLQNIVGGACSLGQCVPATPPDWSQEHYYQGPCCSSTPIHLLNDGDQGVLYARTASVMKTPNASVIRTGCQLNSLSVLMLPSAATSLPALTPPSMCTHADTTARLATAATLGA